METGSCGDCGLGPVGDGEYSLASDSRADGVRAKPKAILCGHTHIAEVDGFSETAKMYVAGGNYEGRAYEIVFK